ncbi:MAG: hypothetical protein HY051_04530 [Candidatus Aenigmarchaeota archaeon]|nr:hypothetical protein [Candidatus Aenigmarchaeota archaeon]
MREISFFAALLVIPFAVASYITINAQLPEIFLNDKTADAKFVLSNTGDEPAFSVQTSVKSANAEFPTLFTAKLEPNQQVDTFFTVNLTKELLPGRYPVAIITEYTDANNYPFSAVSTSYLVYKERTSSEISSFLEDVKVPKGGKAGIKLKIINRDSGGRNAKIDFFVPKELFAGGYNKNVSLRPGEQKTVDAEISSLSALQGSTYTIFATVEYEDSGKHYSSFSRGLVNITNDAGLFSNITIAAAVLVLIAAVAARNFQTRKR